MARIAESPKPGEKEATDWKEFSWVIDSVPISGKIAVIESSEKLMRVRVAVGIPQDAKVIKFGLVSRNSDDRYLETGESKWKGAPEDMTEISWWSPGLGIGRNYLIPRELVEKREENAYPLRIQVCDVSLFTYDSDGKPTILP